MRAAIVAPHALETPRPTHDAILADSHRTPRSSCAMPAIHPPRTSPIESRILQGHRSAETVCHAETGKSSAISKVVRPMREAGRRHRARARTHQSDERMKTHVKRVHTLEHVEACVGSAASDLRASRRQRELCKNIKKPRQMRMHARRVGSDTTDTHFSPHMSTRIHSHPLASTRIHSHSLQPCRCMRAHLRRRNASSVPRALHHAVLGGSDMHAQSRITAYPKHIAPASTWSGLNVAPTFANPGACVAPG